MWWLPLDHVSGSGPREVAGLARLGINSQANLDTGVLDLLWFCACMGGRRGGNLAAVQLMPVGRRGGHLMTITGDITTQCLPLAAASPWWGELGYSTESVAGALRKGVCLGLGVPLSALTAEFAVIVGVTIVAVPLAVEGADLALHACCVRRARSLRLYFDGAYSWHDPGHFEVDSFIEQFVIAA